MGAQTDFRLFGPLHLLILAAIPAAGFLLSRRVHSWRKWAGAALMVNELIWYAYRLSTEGWRFPEAMPLQLCDLAVWLTVVAAFLPGGLAGEAAYFAGVGGSAQAVLTPDLWAPMLSYPTIYFFAAHGGVIAINMAFAMGGVTILRPGCVWRALGILNGWMVFVALFNWVYGTNYMYLCRKPASASLLDALGPWPWYILAGEVIAVAVFWLLWLPFQRKGRLAPAP